MKKYKPEYLGKVLPDEGPKRKDFLQNEYEPFSEIYDACKDESEDITDIKNLTEELGSPSLNIKVTTTSEEVLHKLSDKISNDPESNVSISGDVLTSKKKKLEESGV